MNKTADMKTLPLLILLFISIISNAQDTLSVSTTMSGGTEMIIVAGMDTFLIETYSNGAILGKMRLSALKPNQRYNRYYPNGNFMYQVDIENSKANGRAKYFSEEGRLVADLKMKDDLITDTLFISKKHYVLLGNINYSSTVYGGAENEDGTSNVSVQNGNYMNFSFYTVKLDDKSASQKKYKEFITDRFGNFFLCLETGKFGFFLNNYPIGKVTGASATSNLTEGKSMDGSWNLNAPLEISEPGLYQLKLSYTSVSYAP